MAKSLAMTACTRWRVSDRRQWQKKHCCFQTLQRPFRPACPPDPRSQRQYQLLGSCWHHWHHHLKPQQEDESQKEMCRILIFQLTVCFPDNAAVDCWGSFPVNSSGWPDLCRVCLTTLNWYQRINSSLIHLRWFFLFVCLFLNHWCAKKKKKSTSWWKHW